MSGWTDLPLSSLGQSQALRLRDRLEDCAPFAALYSSPLLRARQTALLLAEFCDEPVHLLDDLRELNCGAVDGLPIDHVRSSFPLEWHENLRQENPDFRWPGGESYRELRRRSARALDFIAARHPGQGVIVVTHCGVISQIAGIVHGRSPARWECFRVENASITELAWSQSIRSIHSFNDCCHLKAHRLPAQLQ